MGAPSGVNVQAAVKRAAETYKWADASIGVVRNQIPILSDGLAVEPIFDIQGAVVGSAAQQQADIVGWKLSGPITTELWYESLEPLFLAALGYENPTVTSGLWPTATGGSPAFVEAAHYACVHVFECDDVLNQTPWSLTERAVSSGISTDPTYWLATDEKVRHVEAFVYKEIPAGLSHWNQHAYVRRAPWRVKPGECAAEWDLVARRAHRAYASGYGTTWALPASRKRCLFPELHVYVSAVGATLSTEYGVREVEIILDNALQEGEFGSAATGAQYILEPIREGTRKVSGKLKIPRYTTEQWESWRDAKTALQLMVTLATSTNIPNSTVPYRLDFILPAITITKVGAPVGGAGVISVDVEFTATKPAGTQTWLTSLLGGITQYKGNELLVRLVNGMQERIDAPAYWFGTQESGAFAAIVVVYQKIGSKGKDALSRIVQQGTQIPCPLAYGRFQ
jgi:hypothetical protein